MTRAQLLQPGDTLLAGFGQSTVDRSGLTKGKNIVGTPNFTQSSTAFRAGYRAMTNINDYVEYEEILNAGTWALVLETVTAASGGTFLVTIDGVLVATNDTYIVSGGGATRTETTGLVIATTGKHLIRCTVTTKNASASATTCRISGYTMTRTGA
jgi:hypothetical protein